MITGAKKESDLSLALTKLYPVLLEFKKVGTGSVPDSAGPLTIGNSRISASESQTEEV